ncbi:MAG: MarR family transcriptional regulator [Planctomycetota bacterium]|nr:MAG: MarR family transcriptional regulator [Planctomycetota bacterium]
MSLRGPSQWTFLSNHTHVLLCLHRQADMRIRDIASQVGITDRAVQRILHELSSEGYIHAERVGRRNSYTLAHNKMLRHHLEAHCSIRDLLELLT